MLSAKNELFFYITFLVIKPSHDSFPGIRIKAKILRKSLAFCTSSFLGLVIVSSSAASLSLLRLLSRLCQHSLVMMWLLRYRNLLIRQVKWQRRIWLTSLYFLLDVLSQQQTPLLWNFQNDKHCSYLFNYI